VDGDGGGVLKVSQTVSTATSFGAQAFSDAHKQFVSAVQAERTAESVLNLLIMQMIVNSQFGILYLRIKM